MAKELQAIPEFEDVTPEGAALSLLNLVARAEGKNFDTSRDEGAPADRKWILDTYSECLFTAKGHRAIG